MRTKQVIEELAKYLPPDEVEQLKINMALPGSIVMCLCIADITRNYNSTPEREKEVSRLLSALCNIHFKTISA
jgi:hypothetical protein